MTEANLYQLTTQPLNKALPRLIETVALGRNKKIRVLCNDAAQMRSCDDMLWSYAQLSFVPHGTCTDPYPDKQLVYITNAVNDNANNASVAVIYDVANIEEKLSLLSKQEMEKIVLFLDPTQQLMREELHKVLSKLSIPCKVFIQDAEGLWKAAVS